MPVDMRNFRRPKAGMALTALAGPVSNLLIAAVFLFLYGLLAPPLYRSEAGGYLLQMLYLTAYLSLALAVFNFLPIPPLDGSKVLFSALSDRAYWSLMRYERYGFILLTLVLVTGIIDKPLSLALDALLQGMRPAAELGLRLGYRIF